MTDLSPLDEADPLGEPTDDEGGSSEDPGQPLVVITQPTSGTQVDPGLPIHVAGNVDRDGRRGSSTTTTTTTTSTTTTTTSTSTTTSTTTTSTGPPAAACGTDGANGILGLAPAAPPSHDLTKVCFTQTTDELVLTATVADMSAEATLACSESPVSYGFWINAAASPVEVMCFQGPIVANWEADDPFGTGATATFDPATDTVTVSIPRTELSAVGLSAPYTVHAETYNGPGVYGGRPMWLTGSLVGFGLYVDRAPDDGAVASGSRLVASSGPTRLPALAAAAGSVGQSGEQALYFVRGTAGLGNADIALGGSLMSPDRPTWTDPAVVVAQNQFGGTNVRTIYDATWQYDGPVDLQDANIEVTWHAAAATATGAALDWDVSAYVYTGVPVPNTNAPQATVRVAHPIAAEPSEHKATLTGVTGAGEHLVILVRPAFSVADNLVSAATILYDAAAYPSGILVRGDVTPPPAERVEVYDGTTLVATSASLATAGTLAPAAWNATVTFAAPGPHQLVAKWLDADGTLLDQATVAVDVRDPDPCAGVTDAPVLSGLAWTSTRDTATVTWTTDVPSSSVVDFGATPSYGAYASSPGATTQHSVTLEGLTPDTVYHYRVTSARCGLAAQSADNTLATAGRRAAVTLDAPGPDNIVEAPVSFAGRFDAGDEDGTRSGTGAITAGAGSASLAASLQGVLASPEWAQAQAVLSALKGFQGAAPGLDGTVTVHLAGKVPKAAPRQVAGLEVVYVPRSTPQTLAAPVDAADFAQARHDTIEEAVRNWNAMQSEPGGPALPGLADGIGPGTAMLQGNDGIAQLCSVSFVMQDPRDPEQYYLATAGHCLLSSSQGVDRTGEANPSAVFNHFELCYAGCIDNALGLGSYVVLQRTAGFEPVAYASAAPVGAIDADGIGRDFGLLRVPKDLNAMLRPWMPQWGGPDGHEPALFGDAVVHYGHGTYCCPLVGGIASRTPADQGRVAVALGTFADGSFENVGWLTGGDSGSPSSIGFLDDDKGLRGAAALGVNTHGLVSGVGIFDGTLLAKGQAMVQGRLGFTPRLVTAAEDVRLPSGGEDPTEVAFVSPPEGAVLEGARVTVTGTATFPIVAGQGTQDPITYYLHRPACGGAEDTTFMDRLPAPAAEEGHGCGNLGATRMAEAWPATADPGTPVPAGSAVEAHVKVFGLRPHAGVVLTGTLKADGAAVGTASSAPTDVVGVAFVATPCTEFVLSFTTTASFPADADLVFEAATQDGTQDLPVCYEGGTDGSRVAVTPRALATTRVQLSVDDPTFAAQNLLAVDGTSAWSADWDLASVAPGPHTLHARLTQDGVPAGEAVTRAVTVAPRQESGLRTQLRLVGPGLAGFDWTTVAADGGARSGSWSHGWAPDTAPSGRYTAFVRLVDGQAVLATTNTTFIVDTAPELAVPPEATASEGRTLRLFLNATDADGDALSYKGVEAGASALPAGAAVDGPWFTWTPGHDQAGTYRLVFFASDGYRTAVANVTVTVQDVNRAPVLNETPDQTVAARGTLEFVVTAHDPDGDHVTVAATRLPAGATFDPTTSLFRWTPRSNQVGTHEASFQASDGGLVDTHTLRIHVTKK